MSYFWEVGREAIFSIPLGVRARSDMMLWHYEDNGCYTVRSGYKVAMDSQILESCVEKGVEGKWWKRLWKLNVPSKVKILIWHVYHNALPVRDLYAKRWVNCPCPRSCPCCREEVEDVSHIFLRCAAALECKATLLHIAEALSTREEIPLAQSCGLKHWLLESDAVNIIRAIQRSSSRAPESYMIADIKETILHTVSGKTCYISRCENNVAHFLTNLVFQNFSDLLCYEFVPLVLRLFVLFDLQASE
ncbi:hypothetical protein TIFTF001_018782 [Ficus carica]|uniref:Reverse transcriptase zinc-binding domain-containing protein n=1 Tax=Ficus carica TaxID=3494 RepID=A0AA88AD46_FICCA|nr:hypothetical protein TIFTF001_018782 [Ficus carica]